MVLLTTWCDEATLGDVFYVDTSYFETAVPPIT